MRKLDMAGESRAGQTRRQVAVRRADRRDAIVGTQLSHRGEAGVGIRGKDIRAGKIGREGVVRHRWNPGQGRGGRNGAGTRSEEHTSELQSPMRLSYAVFCLKKKTEQH